MPELPEVETIRRSLAPSVGSRITGIDVFKPEVIRRQDYPAADIYGEPLDDVGRRGKFLLLVLGNRHWLIIHLGMSGRLYMAEEEEELVAPHIHVVIHWDNDKKFVYQDPRRFGGLWFVKDIGHFFDHMGVEPLSRQFTAAYLSQITKNRRVAIKNLLLNQNLIAGIGNIYADESLFAAGIRPDRAAGSLTSAEVKRLNRAIKKVLRNSIAQRGTSFRDYRDGYNQKGNFQKLLKVYGRTNLPCTKCGRTLTVIRLGGRSSHFCDHCQR
ncbi:MAG: bifunctional DNA-formamidopyrimidine glycosylase/DNA-(apurinic or apyrimidinic site) lyase [Syntrophomonadaceae bacterium]|jgi:formamidopyrimidine-DNA glycosylase